MLHPVPVKSLDIFLPLKLGLKCGCLHSSLQRVLSSLNAVLPFPRGANLPLLHQRGREGAREGEGATGRGNESEREKRRTGKISKGETDGEGGGQGDGGEERRQREDRDIRQRGQCNGEILVDTQCSANGVRCVCV